MNIIVGSSSKADNKYPADFTNILKKFTNNDTRIKCNKKSYNNIGSASPYEFPPNYDPDRIRTTNEYNSYLFSHPNLTKDLDYVQIYHPNSIENRLLMYWQNEN